MNFSVSVFLGLVWLFAAGPCWAQKRGRSGLPVSKVVVYTRFLPAGSTMGLANAFLHPADYGAAIDTANLNRAALLSGADFSRLLAEAKPTKHHQMKIAGIQCAGQLVLFGVPHAFLYCPPAALIDLTERVNYLIPRDRQSRWEATFSVLSKGK